MRDAEELLEQTADLLPLTPQEVCDRYGIDIADFPGFAVASLERELETNRTLRRLYCDRKNSGELMRQIDRRIPEIRRSIYYWSDKAQREGREARD